MHIENMSLTAIEKTIINEIKGKELWGDISFSENDYEVLREHIATVLEHDGINMRYICKNYPCSITTFLVFLMRYKYDTNFWGMVSSELNVSIYGPIETEIGTSVRKTFAKYEFDFSDVKDEVWKNLAPILYEAGLPPESSLDDLFYILNYDSYSVFEPQLIIDDLVEMRSYQIRKPMLRFLKRFKEDRAIEFMLEVHDAMLSIDQNMAVESRYIAKYGYWKSQERSKETTNRRKQKEFQTKPQFMFDNGKKGICIVLPRTIMNNEWVEEVEWIITGDGEFETHRQVTVFGNEGQRYIDALIVPVCPASQYKITLIDSEELDDDNIIEWSIDGVPRDGMMMFNANGRIITPTYLQSPFSIVVLSEDAVVSESCHVNIMDQVYPTSRKGYLVKSIEPLGGDASVSFNILGKRYLLNSKPQINLSFDGKTLFSLPTKERLFIEIPDLYIEMDEEYNATGLEIRMGKETIALEKLFEQGTARISLSKYKKEIYNQYGTYSIRLYQYDHFIKQIEFCYLPKIKSNYSAYVSWPSLMNRKMKQVFKFQRNEEWILEFNGCIVNSDEENYTVECPSNVGVIRGALKSNMEEAGFYCKFELPINPFEIDILDSTGIVLDNSTDKVHKLGLVDIGDNEYWISLSCFGEYKHKTYQLKLKSANGIEQMEKVILTYNGCSNYNLASFYDTIQNCPLPAQLELCCEQEDHEDILPILIVSDTVQLKVRPEYNTSGYIVLGVDEGERDLIIKRFGRKPEEQKLPYFESRLGNSKKTRGYPCKERLSSGLYVIESNMQESNFIFEDNSGVLLTNGNNVVFVAKLLPGEKISTFSNWLDWLISDVIKTGINHDLQGCGSFINRDKISNFKDKVIEERELELLVALAYFADAKCIKMKKNDICLCMRTISECILTTDQRLELVRFLADIQCPQEIFDICMQEYNLYLFTNGNDDSKVLAEKIEKYSAELSMLLLMGTDESIRNTIWRDKYKEIIGKEAIKSLLSVPGEEDTAVVAEEQRKFIREMPSKVKINLSNEIVGDMKPIQNMLEITPKHIYFNKAKKPDFGIYFAHIRYVDQYVNWYSLSHNRDGELISWKRQKMVELVKSECKEIMDCILDLKKDPICREAVMNYDKALQSRFNGNPMADLNSAKYARYFYLQGLAALLAKIPPEFKYGWATRTGEQFMAQAITIAPRIARRDLIMASTYIYLKRKEKKLCQ